MSKKRSQKEITALIELQNDLIVPVNTNNKERDEVFNRLILDNLDMTPKWNDFISKRFHTDTSLFQSIADFIKQKTDGDHTESDVLSSVVKFGFSKFVQSYLLSTKEKFQSALKNDLGHVYGNKSTSILTDHLTFVSDMFEMFTQMNILKHENARTLHTISLLNLADNDVWMNLGSSGYDAIRVQKSKSGFYLNENNEEIPKNQFLDCLYYTVSDKAHKDKLKNDNPNLTNVLFANKNIEIKTIENEFFKYNSINDIYTPAFSFLNKKIQLNKNTPKQTIKENYDGFVIAIVKKYDQSQQFIFFNKGNQKRKLRKVVKQTRSNYEFYDQLCANQNIRPLNYWTSASIPIWEFLSCGFWQMYNTKNWIQFNGKNL